MAFGDNNDNNSRKYYEPTVYSAYAMSNTDGVDPSALNFQFSLGLLKITISPMLPNAKPGDSELWDRKNGASIWLTHTKARMLAESIKEMLNGKMDEINNESVPSGNGGLITFSNGKELGATSPCLMIRKQNPDTGEVTSTYAYQFKSDYHYTIRNFDPATKEFEKIFFPSLEIEQFITLLETYYTSMSGAQAYGVLSGAKVDIQKTNTKFRLIMDKLGIEQPTEYSKGGNGYSNRSFFSGNGNSDSSTSGAMNPPSGDMRRSSLDDIAG